MTKRSHEDEGDEETGIFDQNDLASTTAPDNPQLERAQMATVIAPLPPSAPPPLDQSARRKPPTAPVLKNLVANVPPVSDNARTLPAAKSSQAKTSDNARTIPAGVMKPPTLPSLPRTSGLATGRTESSKPAVNTVPRSVLKKRSESEPNIEVMRRMDADDPPTLSDPGATRHMIPEIVDDPITDSQPAATRIVEDPLRAANAFARGAPAATPSRARAPDDARGSQRNRAVDTSDYRGEPRMPDDRGSQRAIARDVRESQRALDPRRPAPDTQRGRPSPTGAPMTKPPSMPPADAPPRPPRAKSGTGPRPGIDPARPTDAPRTDPPRSKSPTGAPSPSTASLGPGGLRGMPIGSPPRPTPNPTASGSRPLAPVQRVERMPVRLDGAPPPSRTTAALEPTVPAPGDVPADFGEMTNPAVTMPRMEAFTDSLTPKPTMIREMPRAPQLTPPGPEMTLTGLRQGLPPQAFETPPPHMEVTGPDSAAYGAPPDVEMTDAEPPIAAPEPTRIGIVENYLPPRKLPEPVMPPAGDFDNPGRMIPPRLQKYTPTSMQTAPAPEPVRKIADHVRMYTPTSMVAPDPQAVSSTKLRAETEHSGDKLPNPAQAVALDAVVFTGDKSEPIQMISMKNVEDSGNKREPIAHKPQLRSINDVQKAPLGPPPAGFGFLAPPRDAVRPTAPRKSRLVWWILATLVIAIGVATAMYLLWGEW